MENRGSISMNSSASSTNRSLQMDTAIPQSKISSLSSGEFVGMVADDPDSPIELKAFHCKIKNEDSTLQRGSPIVKAIPVARKIDPSLVQQNYAQIKQDVKDL